MRMFADKKKYIKLAPAVIVIATLFMGGIYNGFKQSIKLTSQGDVSLFSFSNYKVLLTSEEFYNSFFLTLKIATIATVISAVIALFIGYSLFLLNSQGKIKKSIWFQNKLKLPMLLPYLTAAYIIYLLFSRSGYISRILQALGVINSIEDFPVIVNDLGGIGIILTYIWKATPFILLMIFPVILKCDKRWIDAAAVLGVGRRRFFFTVVLKLIEPTLLMAMYIVFSYTFASFETAYILGVTSPKTLSVYSYLMYTNGVGNERGMALAVNFLVVIFIIIIGIVLLKYIKKRGVYGKK